MGLIRDVTSVPAGQWTEYSVCCSSDTEPAARSDDTSGEDIANTSGEDIAISNRLSGPYAIGCLNRNRDLQFSETSDRLGL